jgi:hypothetical protein
MRRPASNSCLLLPKPSEEEAEIGSTTNVSSPLSVTLIHQTTLPTYSSERFFLLSELHVHAQSILFLSHAPFADGDEDQSTQATEDETVEDSNCDTVTSPENEALVPITDTSANNPSPRPTQQLPPFVILYMLWKPEMTTNPEIFTELYILDAVQRIDAERNRTDPNHVGGEAPNNEAAKEIYLIIDRVLPAAVGMTIDDDQNVLPDHSTDDEEVEDSSLALEYTWVKYLAAHPVLRTRLQGVVLGQSNHVRAAPGLELCTHAISTVGATERRRWSGPSSPPPPHDLDSTKSWMGLVTPSQGDLLGLQEEGVTDAADGVRQRIVTGEWMGQGDIYMFATRAHALWRQQHGIMNDRGEEMSFGYFGEKRSVPRRKSRAPITTLQSLYNPQRRRRGMIWFEIPHSVYETVGYIVIALYVFFHYGRRDDDILVIRVFRPVLQGFAALILTWNKVIQSARGW